MPPVLKWLTVDAPRQTEAPAVAVTWQTPPKFAVGRCCKNPVPVATLWLHGAENEKARYRFDSALSFVYLGWLMGLEPTTTGITILDSTN